jgi:hypothetical protein
MEFMDINSCSALIKSLCGLFKFYDTYVFMETFAKNSYAEFREILPKSFVSGTRSGTEGRADGQMGRWVDEIST